MPGRYPSDKCQRCKPDEISETIRHRFIQCRRVSHIWNWLLEQVLVQIEPLCANIDDFDLLCLNFPRTMRDNGILWLIGTYVDIIEKEILIRENAISVNQVRGLLKQRKLMTRYQAIPELGIIPHLDFEPQGIG